MARQKKVAKSTGQKPPPRVLHSAAPQPRDACTAAGLPAQAITYRQAAGQRAIMRSANLEAIRHLETGLELLSTLPDTPEHLQRELMLHMTLGATLMTTKGFTASEAEKAFTRARELCQHLGEAPQLIPVLWGLCAFHQVRRELPIALELAEQVFRLARQLQDPDCLAAAHYALGSTHFWMGAFTKAQEHMVQSVALYKLQRHQAQVLTYGQDFGVTSRSYPIICLWHLGYPEQALRQSNETLALPQAIAHPYSRLFALYASAMLHCWLYQWSAVRNLAQTITELATAHDLEFYRRVGSFLALWADAMQLQPEHERLPKGAPPPVHQRQEVLVGYSCALSVQAQACLQAGQSEDGLHIIAQALAHIERTDERWYEAEVWRVKGEILLTQQIKNQKSKIRKSQSAIGSRGVLPQSHRRSAATTGKILGTAGRNELSPAAPATSRKAGTRARDGEKARRRESEEARRAVWPSSVPASQQQARRSSPDVLLRLQLVHGRVWHARSARGQGSTRPMVRWKEREGDDRTTRNPRSGGLCPTRHFLPRTGSRSVPTATGTGLTSSCRR